MAERSKGAQALVLEFLVNNRLCVTLDELAAAVDRPRKKITAAISRLITDKYVVRRDRGCYEATAAGRTAHAKGYKPGPQRAHTGDAKPRQNTFRQRVWKTLRLRRKASSFDLLTNAGDGGKATEDNLHHYLRGLERAGYVQRLARRAPGTAPTSNGYAVWLLLKDTGPLAPIVSVRKAELRDPNTSETVSLAEASEVAA